MLSTPLHEHYNDQAAKSISEKAYIVVSIVNIGDDSIEKTVNYSVQSGVPAPKKERFFRL